MPAVDLASPTFKRSSHTFYTRLRQEAPVFAATLPGKRSLWLITRYEDAAAALKDPRLVKNPDNALVPGERSKQPWVPGFFRPLTRNMLDLDPPDHTRLRALVQKTFTTRMVDGLRSRVESLTAELLSEASARGSFDLIRDYAFPIPATVIAEMLGVPVEDRRRFRRWSSGIVAAEPSGWRFLRAIPNAVAFVRYIRRLVKLRRRFPREDLISELVAVEEAGARLSEDELVAMIFLLLIAGHETTVNLIGNGTLALLRHPGTLDEIRRRPELAAPAVEELLRYDGPLEMATERYAREDLAIGGVTIPRGSLAHVVLASANRDERQFPDPDDLVLSRQPNRHLAFGSGIHFCLGAPLARLEGQIAIQALADRAPSLRLAVDPSQLRWKRGLVLRGLEALPVTI